MSGILAVPKAFRTETNSFCICIFAANYMDNWKCTGILKGNGSPVNGGSQQGIFNTSLGSANTSLQNSLNGSSASR